MSLIEKFKELESKQKVTISITAFLLLVFIYLAYDTFFSKEDYSTQDVSPSVPQSTNAKTIPPTTTQNLTTNNPISASINNLQNNVSIPPLIKETEVSSSVEKVPANNPTPEQLALLKQNESLQQEYLKLLNEYQIAQLQQKLMTTHSAIAAARLKVLTTEVEARKIQAKVDENNNPDTVKQASEKPTNIVVAYVGEKRGQWIAMLKMDDGYFEVKEGTELPDNAIVDAINEKGVVVEKNGEKHYFRVPRSLD